MIEGDFIEFFRKNPSRGIVSIQHVREAGNKERPKTQVIEELYDGTIGEFLDDKKFVYEPQKLSVFRDLLTGLSHLHAYVQPANETTMTDSRTNRCKKLTTPPTGGVHYDIKPGNILVRRHDEGLLEAVITDFGQAGRAWERSGTVWL